MTDVDRRTILMGVAGIGAAAVGAGSLGASPATATPPQGLEKWLLYTHNSDVALGDGASLVRSDVGSEIS